MIETIIEWEIGDRFADDHGQIDTRIIAVGHPEGTLALQELKKAEDALAEKYDIHLEKWFRNCGEDSILYEEAEKLVNLGINAGHARYDEDFGFYALCVDDYFEIWKKLIEKVDPTLTIREIQYPTFYGRCTGYGLF